MLLSDPRRSRSLSSETSPIGLKSQTPARPLCSPTVTAPRAVSVTPDVAVPSRVAPRPAPPSHGLQALGQYGSDSEEDEIERHLAPQRAPTANPCPPSPPHPYANPFEAVLSPPDDTNTYVAFPDAELKLQQEILDMCEQAKKDEVLAQQAELEWLQEEQKRNEEDEKFARTLREGEMDRTEEERRQLEVDEREAKLLQEKLTTEDAKKNWKKTKRMLPSELSRLATDLNGVQSSMVTGGRRRRTK